MIVREARVPARQTAQKPKSYLSYSFPGPSLGLVAMNNLAVAMPGSATVLENIFPTPEGGIMRRGKLLYATLGAGDKDVTALFSYALGARREFFGATEDTIYNITTITNAKNIVLGTEDDDILATENDDMLGLSSTYGTEQMTGLTGGKWIVVQFATAGGVYLVGVNGQGSGFVYDGEAFYPQVAGGVTELGFNAEVAAFTAGETVTGGTSGATATIWKVESDGTEGRLFVTDIAGGPFQSGETLTDGEGGEATAANAGLMVPGTNVTFPNGVSLTTADLSYVWIYKNRLWFIQKDSLSAWYHDVDQIAGELTEFPMGGVFGLGGQLTFGTTWSQDVGDGLNALCAFISSEGEAAVYQGSNPESAQDWGIVGVYQTGKPMGPKAHIRFGGDVVMASDIAFVPLSEALRRDYSQLGVNSLSAPIKALWPQEVEQRRAQEWNCVFWSAKQMVVVALPTIDAQTPRMLVMNAETGKWSVFTNWNATCLHMFNNRLFCGDTLGRVYELNVTGMDDGTPYTATYIPTFDQMGEIGNKTVHMVRAVMRSAHKIRERMSVHTDYVVKIPAAPDSSAPTPSSAWGAVVWGSFKWGSSLARNVQQIWRNQFGAGEVVSVGVQVTSGNVVPLDVEFVRTDVLFTKADIVV